MLMSQGQIRSELNLIPASGDLLNVLILLDAEIDIQSFSINLSSLRDYIHDKHGNISLITIPNKKFQ